MKQLSVTESFQFAWNTFTKRPLFFVGIAVITGLLPRVLNEFQSLLILNTMLTENSSLMQVLNFSLTMLSIALILYFAVSLIKIFLKVIDNEPVSYADVFKVKKKELLLYIGASIIFGVFVLVGFVFFLIPGIYLAIKYQFYPYFIIEKKMSPSEALNASESLTKGHLRKLLVIGLIATGLQLLGGIFNLLTNYEIIQIPGLSIIFDYAVALVTLPVLGLLEAHLYRTLTGTSKAITQ